MIKKWSHKCDSDSGSPVRSVSTNYIISAAPLNPRTCLWRLYIVEMSSHDLLAVVTCD